MNLNELAPGPDSKKLAQITAKTFGFSVDLQSLDLPQAKNIKETFTNKLKKLDETLGANAFKDKRYYEAKLIVETVDQFMRELGQQVGEATSSDASAMSDEAHELVLFGENDYDLYRQRTTPIVKNLAKKMAKGVYDSALATKLWMYWATDAAKRYAQQHSTGDDWNRIFSVPVRKEVAAYMEDYWKGELELGNTIESVEEGLDWKGTADGEDDANLTDHTFAEAKEYMKSIYSTTKQYRVRRAEPGFRAYKKGNYDEPDQKELNKSSAHVTDVDSAIDYLKLKKNAMMSGSKQVTPSIGYSWMVYENPAKGIGVLYYQDRGMGSDEIYIGGKDAAKHKEALQIFRDAGVIPTPKRKEVAAETVEESIIVEGEMDTAEAVMAARSIVDRIQGMLEDLGEVMNEDLPPLTDTITDQMGADMAAQYNSAVKTSVQAALEAMTMARQGADSAARMLTGESAPVMGEPADMPMEPTTDMDMDMEQPIEEPEGEDIAAADAAQGGDEALGRERR